MKKSEQIKRFKLLYFSALNLGGMPESFLEKLDDLALQIEKEHPQVNEAFELYEKAVVKAIDSLDMDFPFSMN